MSKDFNIKQFLDAFGKEVEALEESVMGHVEYETDDGMLMENMDADELEGIKEEIKELVYQAMDLVDSSEKPAARSYWFAHILTALDGESEFMGGSMQTMQDTIDAMRERTAEEEPEGFDDAVAQGMIDGARGNF